MIFKMLKSTTRFGNNGWDEESERYIHARNNNNHNNNETCALYTSNWTRSKTIFRSLARTHVLHVHKVNGQILHAQHIIERARKSKEQNTVKKRHKHTHIKLRMQSIRFTHATAKNNKNNLRLSAPCIRLWIFVQMAEEKGKTIIY